MLERTEADEGEPLRCVCCLGIGVDLAMDSAADFGKVGCFNQGSPHHQLHR